MRGAESCSVILLSAFNPLTCRLDVRLRAVSLGSDVPLHFTALVGYSVPILLGKHTGRVSGLLLSDTSKLVPPGIARGLVVPELVLPTFWYTSTPAEAVSPSAPAARSAGQNSFLIKDRCPKPKLNKLWG